VAAEAQGNGRLAGLRALVTGASSGIGRATAELFAAEGAAVSLVARREDVLEEMAESLGQGVLPIAADVADPDAAEGAVTRALDFGGGLDIVVNAAGIDGPVALPDLDAATWKETIDVNLSGTFYVARAAGLAMRDAGSGTIVNVGSELSSIGMGLYVHYCASKAGVIGLTKALAAELAPSVTVNAVCPGPVDTPMMDAELEWFPDPRAARAGAIERVPLKRFAAPQEVAATILYLAVDAPFATGLALALDGGTTAV
jgi:NAD(P)-dependent dehydrogenase (short-subunit alcohol dehydrogenase family)